MNLLRERLIKVVMSDKIGDLKTALREYNGFVELTSIAITAEADMRRNLPKRELGVRKHGTVSKVAVEFEKLALLEVEEKKDSLSRLADLLDE